MQEIPLFPFSVVYGIFLATLNVQSLYSLPYGRINAFSRVLNQKVKTRFCYGFSIDGQP
jgi:hypothetical protein